MTSALSCGLYILHCRNSSHLPYVNGTSTELCSTQPGRPFFFWSRHLTCIGADPVTLLSLASEINHVTNLAHVTALWMVDSYNSVQNRTAQNGWVSVKNNEAVSGSYSPRFKYFKMRISLFAVLRKSWHSSSDVLLAIMHFLCHFITLITMWQATCLALGT